MWQFWIDRGGTFTDIVARAAGGRLETHKLLSLAPERYEDAALQGIRDILGLSPTASLQSAPIAQVKIGTTLATNALLERRGEKTLLVVTKGFRDALSIGDQTRADLFRLDVVKPRVLYAQVREVEERLSADGTIVRALDREHARRQLRLARRRGLRSVAIACLHAYRNPVHESALGDLAVEEGFRYVTLSHRTSPLIKFVPRAETTLLDAYLSPLLACYLQRLEAALGKSKDPRRPKVMVMQSNGGLISAVLARGKDVVLSGPAAGVVGMAQTARASGFTKVIGFDMGGTSTDVSRFDGRYQRGEETRIEGYRLRAPLLRLHTIAAGGGSVLHFDGARMRVGPESAGADPGPTCYGRGGPLALTDCNAILGLLQPNFFPRLFGKSGGSPIDPSLAREKMRPWQQQSGLSPEQLACGFRKIAAESMANAVKNISLREGVDITRYCLQSFGGAAGQHACQVADLLGMTRVLFHPFAGLLSAYGIGLADTRLVEQRQLSFPLSPSRGADLQRAVEDLRAEVSAGLQAQGIAAARILTTATAYVHRLGVDRTLSVAVTTPSRMARAFVSIHKRQFGFAPPSMDLHIDFLSVEGIARGTRLRSSKVFSERRDLPPASVAARVSMYRDDGFGEVPLYRSVELRAGQRIDGPSILIEPTATLILERGWYGLRNSVGSLLLTRVQPGAERARRSVRASQASHANHASASASPDPVMLEVFQNMFMAISERMGFVLASTARSVNIKERKDFSCALFDARGDLIANAPHIPVHLGSMSEAVRALAQRNPHMRRGQVYLLNAPYAGGTHLPDVTVITPLFDKSGRELLFFLGARAHHADIGGRTPGSSPHDSKHIEEEGVVIDDFLLVSAGRLREQALRSILASPPYPCRDIDRNLADVIAQVAANASGARELLAAVEFYGAETLQAYSAHICAYAEESLRRALPRLRSGRFLHRMDRGLRICVSVTLDRENRSAVVDFTGTSAQHEGNFNAPRPVATAAVLYVFRTLVEAAIPLNEGFLAPLRLILPENSIVNPSYPAAVVAGNTEVSQAIATALYGALGLRAASQGTMNNFIYGNAEFQNYETICGGVGASALGSGASAVHTDMTNTRMTDVEILESHYPVRVESFSVRSGSGGGGLHRGGCGVVRALRFLAPMRVEILSSSREVAPFGLAGGSPARCGENLLLRAGGGKRKLKGCDSVEVSRGDCIVLKTPGGGGFGKALRLRLRSRRAFG